MVFLCLPIIIKVKILAYLKNFIRGQNSKITALKENVIFRSLFQSAAPFGSNLWRDAKTVKKFNSLPNPIEMTSSKSQKWLFVENYLVFEIEAWWDFSSTWLDLVGPKKVFEIENFEPLSWVINHQNIPETYNTHKTNGIQNREGKINIRFFVHKL